MGTNIRKIIDFLGSGWFFGTTVAIFAIETSWLAVTSRFPMAFDEAYHLGLIQFFSNRWNPLVSSQPPDTYRYGPIVHDPSWLYHYLMSFPYRFVELFTHDVVVLVISMRLIDVALMVANLFILKKLLRTVGLSGSLTNTVMVVFAFTPMVAVLSAQISYDNLMIPLVTLSLYQTVLLARELDHGYLNVRRFISLLCICLLSSLVKFTFLPVILAIGAVIAWKLVKYWRNNSKVNLLSRLGKDFHKSGSFARVGLISAAVLSVFLFSWFYGANVVRYHRPVPACDQVLGKEACLQNYSWNISYNTRQYENTHPEAAMHLNIAQFTIIHWAFYMSEQLYGAIIPIQGLSYISTPLLSLTIIFFAASVVCLFITFGEILKKYPGLIILLVISFFYVFFLWGYNYLDFLQSGQPAAISGRYLVPVLAYLYAVFGLGVACALRRANSNGIASLSLAVIVISVFVVFGGFSQYVRDVTPNYGRLGHSNKFKLESFGP